MIVFLHGVPETAALWDKVRAEFDEETVALSLPGFGCARPPGFGATKDDYAEWIIGELEQFDAPVDLVGHDWGALLAYRIATTRADLLRSWSADCANGVHPKAKWHEYAQIWQTPGEGEAYFRAVHDAPIEDMAHAYEGFHLGYDDALTLAKWSDDTMATCILDLYRSATPNVHHSWGAQFGPTSAPGLVLFAELDSFSHEGMSHEMAMTLNAREATLKDVGHWWALEAPSEAATVIKEFIHSID
ncbi:MAG: alpha/beta hydrolase [Acidimicrobiales bacterium]|jgi:pimeloyl-ACP methyl ester carboxylesterase